MQAAPREKINKRKKGLALKNLVVKIRIKILCVLKLQIVFRYGRTVGHQESF